MVCVGQEGALHAQPFLSPSGLCWLLSHASHVAPPVPKPSVPALPLGRAPGGSFGVRECLQVVGLCHFLCCWSTCVCRPFLPLPGVPLHAPVAALSSLFFPLWGGRYHPPRRVVFVPASIEAGSWWVVRRAAGSLPGSHYFCAVPTALILFSSLPFVRLRSSWSFLPGIRLPLLGPSTSLRPPSCRQGGCACG